MSASRGQADDRLIIASSPFAPVKRRACRSPSVLLAALLLAFAAFSRAEVKIELMPNSEMALSVSAEGTIAKESNELVLRLRTVRVRNPGTHPDAGRVISLSAAFTNVGTATRFYRSRPLPAQATIGPNEEKQWSSLEFRVRADDLGEKFLVWLMANVSGNASTPTQLQEIALASLQCPHTIEVRDAKGVVVEFNVAAYLESKPSKEAAVKEVQRRIDEYTSTGNQPMATTYRRIMDALSCVK